MTVPQWDLPEELKKIDLNKEAGDHLPDKIGSEPSSKGLDGHTFEYCYPSQIGYRISFNDDKVYFSMPEKVHGLYYLTMSCRVRELRPNQYLTHWLVPGRVGHVALIFDLEANHVDGSALMPGKFEMWDRAFFEKYKVNGVGAIYNKPPTEKPDPW